MEKYTNALIGETSPYLLQHAHNPVNWVPWSPEVFEQARQEDKMVLVSVGYSACHWCHVMERECFEDEEVAELMNRHFINVKVDREERPDVDQVYMTAVQLMTRKGGWPLNCFTLPDGRPVYGGTYFPKEQWMHILRSLEHTYRNDRDKALEYASDLHEGIVRSELIDAPAKQLEFNEEKLHELVLRWSRSWDSVEGGDARAPKFPLPSNYEFLLYYGTRNEHDKTLKHVELTLDKMALGGIYDQVGGGFTRYSVDMLWKVPHFEKMLYDNGQLLSLYSNAYKVYGKPLYKRIVYQTVAWLEREMTSSSGSYYAAIDADSEGEEGKFYCWNKEELGQVLGQDFEWVKEFYSVNQRGFWEEDKYIPLRSSGDKEFAQRMGWSLEQLEQEIARINQILLDERSHRVRPGLDDKSLTGWNAMVLKGMCIAYGTFHEEEFLHIAKRIGRWILRERLSPDGTLIRSEKQGKNLVEGFMEDYAHVIDAFIELYQVTLDQEWLDYAMILTEKVCSDFQDEKSFMFYFTPANTQLIARKMELTDNVIPSSNSVMAWNLYRLSQLYDRKDLRVKATGMLSNMYEGMELYGSSYSGWAFFLQNMVNETYTVAVLGPDSKRAALDLQKNYLPNCVVCGGSEGTLPVLKDKLTEGRTLYFVCYQGTCLLPTQDLNEVLRMV